MDRTPSNVPAHPAAPLTPQQLDLPFLTADQAATIDAARVAVERARTFANGNRRTHEAAELERLGEQLVAMLNDNAARYRATLR